MPNFSLDSSCMIAAVCTWHEHHAAAAAHIERHYDRGDSLVVAGHALVDAYAVLTRLPPPHRLSPRDAHALIEANFMAPAAAVAVLPVEGYPALLRGLASSAIAGGRAYDAVIGATIRHADVTMLLTLNRRHFDPPPNGVSIVDASV